ncbi:MAG TPA: GNAT family N-acetyltransferase [Solirubrobacterales bacterium]|nr:GNAT family N-acetyltransferase [Solirubrobacterales bacterium]
MPDSDIGDVQIAKVTHVDLSELLALMRAYCDFYERSPRDDRLVALARALIADPGEGVQLLARAEDGRALGFATVYWSWDTTEAVRIGVMYDLYVTEGARGQGVGRKLIEACRGACRKRGVSKLTWETAPDNETAQRLYDSTSATSSLWKVYEIEAW